MKLFCLGFIILFPAFSFAQNNADDFQILYFGQMAAITVEKTLYESDSSDHFFIHYRIHNNTHKNIGVNLNQYHHTFYPNQWGIVIAPKRDVIDERRIIPEEFNDSIALAMEMLYLKKQLTIIKPGEFLDYYRDFNNGHKKDVHFKKEEYMYISMDGQLFFTDGEYNFEIAHFEHLQHSHPSDLFLAYPIVWQKIPPNSIIFHED